ncbi:MAG TPA: hypothetical protein VGC79_23470 [Polyangiaceae bacterium]
MGEAWTAAGVVPEVVPEVIIAEHGIVAHLAHAVHWLILAQTLDSRAAVAREGLSWFWGNVRQKVSNVSR